MEFLYSKVFTHSVEVVHVFAVISWMVGMLYLPRIFVYHTKVAKGSEADALFCTMERKLQCYIMNPALIVVLLTGSSLTWLNMAWVQPWWHAKMLIASIMIAIHFVLAYHRKDFVHHIPAKERYFRIINEVPAVLMFLMLVCVIVKPYRI